MHALLPPDWDDDEEPDDEREVTIPEAARRAVDEIIPDDVASDHWMSKAVEAAAPHIDRAARIDELYSIIAGLYGRPITGDSLGQWLLSIHNRITELEADA